MKIKFITALSLILLLSSCKKNEEISHENKVNGVQNSEHKLSNSSTSPVTNNQKVELTEMTFNKTEHDFGTINQGDRVEYTFKFTNSGENDLIISNAIGSCGCTVPEYTKEAIKPGEDGKIKVSFNSAGKSGDQKKTVRINTNTKNGTEILTIKAQIIGEAKKPMPTSKKPLLTNPL